MATLPSRMLDRIAWCKGHAPVWVANGGAIGSDPATTGAFATTVEATDAKMQEVLAARQTARAKEVEFTALYGQMSQQASDLIRTIRAFAHGNGGEQVYATAQIPPPKAPAPVPAPGQPYAPSVQLVTGGALKLSWKCANTPETGGVTYAIHRQDNGGAMTYLGTSGKRTFTDATIPAGSASVTYTITPRRSTGEGTAAQVLVQFGTAGGNGAQMIPMIRKAA